MGNITLDQQLMHIAALLFGGCIYLFLNVSTLYRVQGKELPGGNKQPGWLRFTAFFVFGTLAIIASFLPTSATAQEDGRIVLAPLLLPFMALFFVIYVCWASHELFSTIQWLLHGRSHEFYRRAAARDRSK